MNILILVVALWTCLCGVAEAAISRITSHSAQSSSVSITTPTTNDVIVVFAHRDGNNTAPTLATGYTNINFGGASTNSMRVGYRVSDGTETTSATWTNATSVCAIIYRGVDTTSPVGTNGSTTGSSTTMSYRALNLLSVDGTSWIVAGGGHRTATDVNQNPSGLTMNTSATDIACGDTNTGVSTRSAATTVTVNASSGWITWLVELLPTNTATAGTCKLVQYRSSPIDPNPVTTGSYDLWLPNPSLSGNLLVVGFESGGGTFTITDDQSNVWPASASASVSSGQDFYLWVRPNAAAGTRKITVTVATGTTSYIHYFMAEYYNCKQHLPVDVTWGMSSDAGTALSWGAQTTAQNNELVLSWAGNVTVSDNLNHTRYTPGSSGTLIFENNNSGSFAFQNVVTSAGSFTPTATVVGTDSWTGLAVALKGDDTAGTAPSTSSMFVRGIHAQEVGINSNTTFNYQLPILGNMAAVSWIGQPTTGGMATISSMALNSVAWTQAGSDAVNTGVGTGQMWYLCNITPSDSLVGTITLARNTSGSGFASLAYFYDIANAATSCFDTAANTSGTQSVTGNLTTVSITPTAMGITLAMGPINAHCISGLTTPSVYLFDGATNPGSNGGDTRWQQCDQFGHTVRQGAGTYQYVWSTINNTAGVQEWATVAAAFKEAATASYTPFRRRLNF